jgi:hypothetical protein
MPGSGLSSACKLKLVNVSIFIMMSRHKIEVINLGG